MPVETMRRTAISSDELPVAAAVLSDRVNDTRSDDVSDRDSARGSRFRRGMSRRQLLNRSLANPSLVNRRKNIRKQAKRLLTVEADNLRTPISAARYSRSVVSVIVSSN